MANAWDTGKEPFLFNMLELQDHLDGTEEAESDHNEECRSNHEDFKSRKLDLQRELCENLDILDGNTSDGSDENSSEEEMEGTSEGFEEDMQNLQVKILEGKIPKHATWPSRKKLYNEHSLDFTENSKQDEAVKRICEIRKEIKEREGQLRDKKDKLKNKIANVRQQRLSKAKEEKKIRDFRKQIKKIQNEMSDRETSGSSWTWNELIRNTGKLKFRLTLWVPVSPSSIKDSLFKRIKRSMTKASDRPDGEAIFRLVDRTQEWTSRFMIDSILKPILEANDCTMHEEESPASSSAPWLPKTNKADYIIYDGTGRPLGAIEAKSVDLMDSEAVIQNMLQVRALRCQERGLLFGIVTDAIHFFWFTLDEDNVFEFDSNNPTVTCQEHKGDDQKTCFMDEIRVKQKTTWKDVRRIAATIDHLLTLRENRSVSSFSSWEVCGGKQTSCQGV